MIRHYLQIVIVALLGCLLNAAPVTAQVTSTSRAKQSKVKGTSDTEATRIVLERLPAGMFAEGAVEVVSLRSEEAKHFLNPDGTYSALIGAGPVHYKEDGAWKTILHHILPNAGAVS